MRTNMNFKSGSAIACSLIVVASLTGCYGPYQEEIPVVIPPDSTVNFATLHGSAKGGKSGEKAEEESHIFSKRVLIPTEKRDLGRGMHNFDYIPSVKAVMTTRRPVYRSWTQWEKKGTSTKDEAFRFESLDSINLTAGGVIMAHIEYADTEIFRNKYSGKPLEMIVDRDVRNFLQAFLADRFMRLDFQSQGGGPDCLNQTIPIFTAAFEEAVKIFKEYGITIDFFGNIGGLNPAVAENQERLDRTYLQSMNVLVQRERNREVEVRNRMKVSLAETERKAAEFRFEAKEASKVRELFAAILREQKALNEAAMKWGGVEKDVERDCFKGGGKGKLPAGMMPVGISPLAWMQGGDLQSVLAGLPTELDPKLVEWAKTRVAEIKKEREAERAKQLEEETKKKVSTPAAEAPKQ